MKKWLCLIVIAISAFLLNEHVYAVIDTSTAEIECIYATGVSVTLSRDSTSGNLSAHINEYPVTKSVVISGDQIANISLFDGDGQYPNENIEPLKTLTCPTSIRVWKIAEAIKEESSDWKNSVRGVYSFKYYYDGDINNTITDYYGGTKGKDNSTGWWVFGDAATKKTKVIPLKSNSTIDSYPEVTAPLVAERIYIIGDLEKRDYSVSYKSASSEAVGSNRYIQFFRKSETSSFYAKSGKTMTSIKENTGIIGKDYICFKESIMEQDASRTDSSYKVNSIRHEIASIQDDKTCPIGYAPYKLDDTICAVKAQESKKSFCDEYGNTAKVLVRIINIMQIVVPALVLVLTGVEITRIVLTGNIEEELPKRKKTIIIRLIIMCVFLFLPVITQLVINLINDKDIYDISCLFNDGVTVRENSDECVELDN